MKSLDSQRSLPTIDGTPAKELDVDTVPFVELADGRLRGVVSSGSDIDRVYCAFVEAGSLNYYSSTNNNRPDAGMEKRITWLVEAAVNQFGAEAVILFLMMSLDPAKVKRPYEISGHITSRGRRQSEPSGEIFSRFLDYLRYVELSCRPGPVPEMAWFPGS